MIPKYILLELTPNEGAFLAEAARQRPTSVGHYLATVKIVQALGWEPDAARDARIIHRLEEKGYIYSVRYMIGYSVRYMIGGPGFYLSAEFTQPGTGERRLARG